MLTSSYRCCYTTDADVSVTVNAAAAAAAAHDEDDKMSSATDGL